MQYFTITTALIALTGLANLIQGSTVPTAADMNLTTAALNGTATPGMNVTGPMKWTGPSKGVNITLYGTASEIITQLKALDPEWAPHIPDDGVKNVTAVPVNRGDPDRDFVWGTLFCCPVNDFKIVNRWGILAAAGDIQHVAGSISVAPNTCVLAECTVGTGIYVCNNWQVPLDMDLFNISLYADEIWTCPTIAVIDNLPYSCGQQFDVTGWNVVASAC